MDKTEHISHLPANAESSTDVSAALTDAVVIDQSSVGKIRVTGADRLDLLHRLSTNDILHLKIHSSIGTVFTTDKGRIVDYVRVLVFPTSLLLITSPAQESTLKDWIDRYTIMEDIQLQIITSDLVVYSIVGPEAVATARSMFPVPPSNEICELVFEGVGGFIEHRFEFETDSINIILPAAYDQQIREGFTPTEGVNLRMISQPASESYRIIHGIPRETTELIESFNPYEVNLRHAISFTKGCYIGQEVIARLDTYQKVQRRLVGISLDRYTPTSNILTPILYNSEQVGLLTSVAGIPYKGEYAALGVAKKDKVAVGDMVEVQGESFSAKGVVVSSFDLGA